jgi:peptidoglycan/LPS O-acetylase OafA/YrhL
MNRNILKKCLPILLVIQFMGSQKNLPYNVPCEIKTDLILSMLFNQTKMPDEYSEWYKFAMYSGTGMNDLGDYHNCVSMTYSKYYLITFIVNPIWSVKLGICYFKECDKEYLENSKIHLLSFFGRFTNITITPDLYAKINIQDPRQNIQEYKNKYNTGMIVVSSILGIILLFYIIFIVFLIFSFGKQKVSPIFNENKNSGGISENRENIEHYNIGEETHLPKFLLHFHIFKNAQKLFDIRKTNSEVEHFRVFDGVRVLSTIWVVFAHSFVVPFASGGFKNLEDIPTLGKTLKFCFIISGYFSVDVFFFMSGFLLCYSQYKINRNKNVNKVKLFFVLFISRYLRLLPLYIFLIYGMTYLVPFFKEGPLYTSSEFVNYNCPKYGWHNLLYVNNLIKYESPGMCGGHTWYLANDMQFFVVFLFLYLFFSNYRLLRNLIFGSIFIFSCVYSTIITHQKGYRYDDVNHTGPDGSDYFNDYYIKPWIRVGPYILGIFFFEVYTFTPLFKINIKTIPAEEQNQEILSKTNILEKMNNFLVLNELLCWIILIISIIMIQMTFMTPYFTNNYDIALGAHDFFSTFNKLIFIFGLGCILHLTFLGKFSFIRNFLSLPLFTWLGRFTYGVYLIHYYILTVFVCQYDTIFYLHMSDLFFLAIGYFVFSTLASIVLTLTLESPVISMTKFFFSHDSSKKLN